MSRAVFRADATPQLGGGHVYRCLALAHELSGKGWICDFSCNDEAERVVPMLGCSSFRRLDPKDLGRESVDLLVVDHYDIGVDYETACRSWAERILVIDDLANRRHDADFLIDQNIGRRESDYSTLVSSECRLMIGPAFALVRESFGKQRLAGWRPRREVRRVLVAMGATDPQNATGDVLSGLAGVPGIEIEVALGSAAPYLNAVRAQVEALGSRFNLSVDIDGDAMAALIEGADLAIAAAGGSAWERCSLGLPTLLVVLAENQRSAADHLATYGAARLIGHYPGLTGVAVESAVRALIDDPDILTEMSQAAARVCDGIGARRVAAVVEPERDADGLAVNLRPATASDGDAIFALQMMPEVRRYFHEPRPPSADEHAAWFAASLANTDRLLNMIEVDERPCGVLRLDRVPTQNTAAAGGFSVSILVDPAFAGHGVAKAALRSANRLMAGQRLVAVVVDENIASRRAFEASGYRPDHGLYVNNGL